MVAATLAKPIVLPGRPAGHVVSSNLIPFNPSAPYRVLSRLVLARLALAYLPFPQFVRKANLHWNRLWLALAVIVAVRAAFPVLVNTYYSYTHI